MTPPISSPSPGLPYSTLPPAQATHPGAGYSYQHPGAQWNPAPSPSPTHQPEGISRGMSSEEEMETTGPPVVDRSTKPESLKALSTGWGGEMI